VPRLYVDQVLNAIYLGFFVFEFVFAVANMVMLKQERV